MNRSLASTIEALIAVAVTAWLTSALLPMLGVASSALLFLLPVLLAATRGGVVPGLMAALAGAGAYNFFLLEPRYSFRIHQFDNLVSVFVLVAVALVTSRLATRLLAREAEARESARKSDDAAALSAVLAEGPPETALAQGTGWLAARFGAVRLLEAPMLPQDDAAFSALDLSAAAWAMHNGDATGHGTPVMPPADWTFLPLAARNRGEAAVAALARPVDGRTRDAAELEHLGQLARLLGQCRDRAALDQERRERAWLEERDRLRRTLLASLAHDFRTPLTVITARLELLAMHDPEAGDALASARRLDRMMTDLTAAARIEAGALAPVIESLDLVDVVGAACDALPRPAAVGLEQRVPPELPFVPADPVLLHHVMVNLIDNALRHARTTVRVSASGGDDAVTLRVEDDGPGIPEPDRARVFERFARIEGSDRSGGSGLGLAIVRGFAEAMGMTVSVDRSGLGGACLAVVVPLRSEAPA